MARRLSYSRWDGTQAGFDIGADQLFRQITDDLAYHGDGAAALRRLMYEGADLGENGELSGLTALLERIAQARRDRIERSNLVGALSGIAEELDDIIAEERHAIGADLLKLADRVAGSARAAAQQDAERRQLGLSMLPDGLAERVAALNDYDFVSPEAAHRFSDLTSRLRQQLIGQVASQMADQMNAMTPDDVAQSRDMFAALNEMIAARERGEDPRFDDFMSRFGHMFGGDPETLDELLSEIASRMAAMQAMMNALSPEQRAELAALSAELLGDIDLAWQMDALGAELRDLFPYLPWDSAQPMADGERMGFGEALAALDEIGDLDRLGRLLGDVTNPKMLGEVDLDRVAELLGDDAAATLGRLSQLGDMLESAGLFEYSDGQLDMTPRALRALGANALNELFSSIDGHALGQHQTMRRGSGHELDSTTKPYEFGDPLRLSIHGTVRNAIRRCGGGTPVRLSAEDFEVEQTEQAARSATVLMIDLSMSMPMRDNFLPAKKSAFALHHLISTQFPNDFLGLVGFSKTARRLTVRELPGVSWDMRQGTNMHHGLMLARQMLSRETGSKQIIMITDGEPTAHVLDDGEPLFAYPPTGAALAATLAEAKRCSRAGITLNVFVLDATAALTAFIEQMVGLNGGRAFCTTNDSLGDYILVDFLERQRRVSHSRYT